MNSYQPGNYNDPVEKITVLENRVMVLTQALSSLLNILNTKQFMTAQEQLVLIQAKNVLAER